MNKSAVRHAPMTQFPVSGNHLLIGGVELPRLSARVGKTPFYAYDRRLLTERVRRLRQAMPPALKIHYAMKANPMPAVVQHMAHLVDGFDLASAGEMQVALDTVMAPEHISMAGPGKRPEELMQAIAAGITVNIESPHELDTLVRLADTSGIRAQIAIRVNPAFELKASGMKMGGGAKQFGVDEERVPDLLKRLRRLPVDFKGFHIYGGSQNLKAEAIIETQQKSIELALALADCCPNPIQKLNIGGGFGIPYFPGETALDIDRVGEALAESLTVFAAGCPGADVIIELGRYLVGEAGLYVCQVIDKKISRGQIFLVVNGGLHHHLAASGNFGQVIRKNYPVAIGNKMNHAEQETVSIVGPLCTPLDLLADRVTLPAADIGDWVVVYQSGAYGYTASPHLFLSQPEALQVLA